MIVKISTITKIKIHSIDRNKFKSEGRGLYTYN